MNDDVDGPDRRPTELIVAPTAIGGRRSTQRGMAVAVAAIVFVGATLWKPWDGSTEHPGSTERPGAAARAAGATASATSGAAPASPDGGPASPDPFANSKPFADARFPALATVLAATTREPVWGMRAVVIRGGAPAFAGQPLVVEHWVGVDATVVAGTADPVALPVSGPEDDVAALGVTTLDDALPLDIRFWRIVDGAPPRRLAPTAIPGPEAGSFLWLADPSVRTIRGTWPAGSYAIDVLTSQRIVRLRVEVPHGSPEVVPVVGEPIFEPPIDWLTAGLEPGPYVLAGGRAVHLAGGSPAAGGEREAWLGAAAGVVPPARIASSDVNGIGVVLADAIAAAGLTLEEVAPVPGAVELVSDDLVVGPGERRAIVARPSAIGVLGDGLYRLTLTATTSGGTRTTSWSLEVDPADGPDPAAAPLDAMRRWTGLIDHPAKDSGQPIVLVGVLDDTGSCWPGTRVTGTDRLLGIVTPAGTTIERLRMLPNDVFQSADIPIRYAPGALPQLTIVALPNGGLPIRDYSLFLSLRSTTGTTRAIGQVCMSGP